MTKQKKNVKTGHMPKKKIVICGSIEDRKP